MIIYPDLQNYPESIFSLLLLAGYLKIGKVFQQDNAGALCEVLIPNYEIRGVYKKEIIDYTRINFKNSFAQDIQIALVTNDNEELNQIKNDLFSAEELYGR